MNTQSASSAVPVTGGTGYTVGDILTALGGQFVPDGLPVQVRVGSILPGGIINLITIVQIGAYLTVPLSPVSFTGGTGSGFTANITWQTFTDGCGASQSNTFPQSPLPGCPEQTADWTDPPNPPPSVPAPYRTTSVLVQGIIQTAAGVDLTPFIAAANMLVTNVCTYQLNPYSDGFVGSQMELIERWLAAHFYTAYDAQLVAAKAGSAGASFQYKIDYNLGSSVWGQQAMILDQRGSLAKFNNSMRTKRRVRIGVWGPGCHHRGWWLGDYEGGFELITIEQ